MQQGSRSGCYEQENNVFFFLGIKKYGKDLVNSRKSITFALAFEKYSSAGHIWCP